MAYILMKFPSKQQSLKAFTLVELSIVIVIMGLLVAVTMAGGELLKTSKLRSLIGEIEAYKTAVNSFQVQYEAFPGDMNNAQSFWTTAQNGNIAVSNGNGNGKIDINYEYYYFWNHLTLSKFVPGTFPGNTTTDGAIVGVNIPASKYIDGLAFGCIWNPSPWGYTDTLGRGISANYMFIGRVTNGTTLNYPGTSGFIPADAYYIDAKIDNGAPASGKVLAHEDAVSAACTIGAAPNIAYNLSQSSVACVMGVNMDNK